MAVADGLERKLLLFAVLSRCVLIVLQVKLVSGINGSLIETLKVIICVFSICSILLNFFTLHHFLGSFF